MRAIDQLSSIDSLRHAWKSRAGRLRKSCFGVDRVSASDFERDLDVNLRDIRRKLLDPDKGYQVTGLLALPKQKPNSDKFRVICIPTFADRLVQFAMLDVLRPKMRWLGLDNKVSYGIAPGRENSTASAQQVAVKTRSELPWVYKTDIQQFFDNIDRDLLRASVRKVVRHPSMNPLLDRFLATEIKDGFDRGWREIAKLNGIRVGRGIRQGMPISPLFAGAYLRDFDRKLIKWGVPVARYVDDLVAFFKSEAEALEFHLRVQEAFAEIGLSIDPLNEPGSKTGVYAPMASVPFLGMELARKPSGGYHLLASSDCIAQCAQRLKEAGSVDFLLEKNVTLTRMGQYFEAVARGFLTSYSDAANYEVLRRTIEESANGAQLRVLRNVFTREQLQSLNKKQQRFVGIDRDMLKPSKANK